MAYSKRMVLILQCLVAHECSIFTMGIDMALLSTPTLSSFNHSTKTVTAGSKLTLGWPQLSPSSLWD